MRRLIGTAVALVAFTQIASAADIAAKAPPTVEAPPAPVFSWTGCYIGANFGYGWGRNHVTDFISDPGFDVGSNTGTGLLGGGQTGCDYEAANWVFGAQGIFDASEVTAP